MPRARGRARDREREREEGAKEKASEASEKERKGEVEVYYTVFSKGERDGDRETGITSELSSAMCPGRRHDARRLPAARASERASSAVF